MSHETSTHSSNCNWSACTARIRSYSNLQVLRRIRELKKHDWIRADLVDARSSGSLICAIREATMWLQFQNPTCSTAKTMHEKMPANIWRRNLVVNIIAHFIVDGAAFLLG